MRYLKDIRPFVCGAHTTLREAMVRLNAQPAGRQFQLVIDDKGRLLGTLTDGDLRRAILSGIGLEDAVGASANPSPRVGRVGANVENEIALRAIRSSDAAAFLPVLDLAGQVDGVLLGESGHAPFAALVMAGGFGRRLGDRTRETPKPMLPVGGAPILGHILDRLEQAGVQRIYISVHYLSHKIVEYVEARQSLVQIEIVHEEKPLGTAGAIGLFKPPVELPLLILNGDILTSVDLGNFVGYHREHGGDGTIAVALHEVSIPYGVVRSDVGGALIGIEEKPTVSNFVSAGLYILNDKCRQLVTNGEHLDMPDVFNRGLASGLSFNVFPIHEYWTDVGRIEDLERADKLHSAPAGTVE